MVFSILVAPQTMVFSILVAPQTMVFSILVAPLDMVFSCLVAPLTMVFFVLWWLTHEDWRDERDGADHVAKRAGVFKVGRNAEILHILIHEDLRRKVPPVLSKDEAAIPTIVGLPTIVTRSGFAAIESVLHFGARLPPEVVIELVDKKGQVIERVRRRS
jgi:hypothetical protein